MQSWPLLSQLQGPAGNKRFLSPVNNANRPAQFKGISCKVEVYCSPHCFVLKLLNCCAVFGEFLCDRVISCRKSEDEAKIFGQTQNQCGAHTGS